MSDYIVKKKISCEHPPNRGFATYEANCWTCFDKGFILVEVDLEEAIIELLQNNSVEPIRYA